MNAEGVRLFRQARHDEALERFREASFVDQDNPDGYYNLAATYHRTGRLENRPSDIAQAEKYYNMCRERDPNHPECVAFKKRQRSPGFQRRAKVLDKLTLEHLARLENGDE